jgi:hypothetical protein
MNGDPQRSSRNRAAAAGWRDASEANSVLQVADCGVNIIATILDWMNKLATGAGTRRFTGAWLNMASATVC